MDVGPPAAFCRGAGFDGVNEGEDADHAHGEIVTQPLAALCEIPLGGQLWQDVAGPSLSKGVDSTRHLSALYVDIVNFTESRGFFARSSIACISYCLINTKPSSSLTSRNHRYILR